MAGSRNGVKSHILLQEPGELFTHCYGHTHSLAVSDLLKQVKLLKFNMDTTLGNISILT